jgi:acetolactate synthase-1/2/3 large subunit
MKIQNTCIRTGAYSLFDCLIQNGVEHIFGYPGGAILPIYDELFYWEKELLIKHILIRHEQSAAHAADAYAKSTNKVGVCFATSGPGATNLVTGIATAIMDSIPIVIITGQVSRNFIGTDAFQEIDTYSVTFPIVKYSYKITNAKEIPHVIMEAFIRAQNGRPGPVLIDIPKDVGLEELNTYYYKKYNNNKSGNLLTKKPLLIKILSRLIQSYQPLLYCGGGILRSNAVQFIQQFSKIFQIPITTTLMGKSCYNESDYLSLGMLGMHGTAYANFAISECDLLLAFGARFDDRVTGKLDEFACEAEVFHLDIDFEKIAKIRCPQFSIIGDLRSILLKFFNLLRKNFLNKLMYTKNWLKRIGKWKQSYPIILKNYNNFIFKLNPQYVINKLNNSYLNTIFVTDVGQHQMWSAQLLNIKPKQWLTSGGLGTMGYGLPSSIGAKVANPSKTVICISGDASFQMSIQELGTISQYDLNIKIIILNNGWQGMVRQWQESFYGNRYSNSYIKNGLPNFEQIAASYNINGSIISFKNLLSIELQKVFSRSLPMLIAINTVDTENCYPMVAPGRSNSQMIGLKFN